MAQKPQEYSLTPSHLLQAPTFQPGASSGPSNRYLVLGEGITAPFMALCLRLRGLECDLAITESPESDQDRGSVVLTPGATQVLGDVMGISVPHGSVAGRLISFDHVGNDLCDLDLAGLCEKGDEAPTFYCCDRQRIEDSLLSLCRLSQYACTVLSPGSVVDARTMTVAGEDCVSLRFLNNPGVTRVYRKVIATSRHHSILPDCSQTDEQTRYHVQNEETLSDAKSLRWLEYKVPEFSPVTDMEKRFTPGSQEIVEILTPTESKVIVRPMMSPSRLYYSVILSLSEELSDPRRTSCDPTTFWRELVRVFTGNLPGYISHTMFKPLILHTQKYTTARDFLVYRTPQYVLPLLVRDGWEVSSHRPLGALFTH